MLSQDANGNSGSQAALFYSSGTVSICNFPIVYEWIGVNVTLICIRIPVDGA